MGLLTRVRCADLVAEPRRMPRRIHMADPVDGNSLQEQMGMERCGDSFQAMLVSALIRMQSLRYY